VAKLIRFCGESEIMVQGSSSYALARKLKALKLDLKKWNEEIFGNVGQRKKEMDGIRKLDMIAEGRSLIKDERLKKENISGMEISSLEYILYQTSQ
jgi:hypothetical protein